MSLRDKLLNAKTVEAFPELPMEKKLRAKWRAQIAVSVRKKRAELNMTQKEFAKHMHVTQAMVSKWESGRYNFTIDKLASVYAHMDQTVCQVNEKSIAASKEEYVCAVVDTARLISQACNSKKIESSTKSTIGSSVYNVGGPITIYNGI